ncbi:hypothetical protein Daura_23195 [Dactylosporangium aurantiacum]|uniref:Uncharacterized protein n=1 Tax=Dactylosporangium aurantiacum TaxID=35754 RepID=A0A9Q9IMD4_9ACTN|nr:hypothetical protein [Dactylosporangium aurantiacum]MDG6104007.1 hypothetical protein [Dactylosporangium aurantiacum]UWZ58817.1 hypothetical protein Daura_23195 [Dactylosporangium aurantiacum]
MLNDRVFSNLSDPRQITKDFIAKKRPAERPQRAAPLRRPRMFMDDAATDQVSSDSGDGEIDDLRRHVQRSRAERPMRQKTHAVEQSA